MGRDRALFDFTGKAGQRQVREISDPEVLPVLRALRRRGEGIELLAYQDGGTWRDVRSVDINTYVKEIAGEGFSAKDFRTWHATVLAAIDLAGRAPAPPGERARKRSVSLTVKAVAEQLGNTPAVCRSSYIDPRVFDRFIDEGRTLPLDFAGPGGQEATERAVLALLRNETVERLAA